MALAVGALLRISRRTWDIARSRPLLGVLLGLAFAAALIALFIWRTDLGQLRASLTGVSLPILVAAAAVYFVNIGLQALRWHLLIRHMGSPGPGPLFPALVIGIMGSNLLPLRMGMILRAEYLRSRFGLEPPAVLSAIVVEGWLDGLVLAVLFLPILAVVGSEEGVIRGVLWAGGIAAGSLLLLRLALTGRWGGWWRSHRPRLSLPLPQVFRSALASILESAISGLAAVRSGSIFTLALLTTAAAWLVKAAVFYLVGLAFPLDVDWSDYLVVTAAISAVGAIQVSQGNVGPYELVVAEVMVGLGAVRGEAAAYAIVSHGVLFFPVTVLGLLFFLRHRISVASRAAGQAVIPTAPDSRMVSLKGKDVEGAQFQ